MTDRRLKQIVFTTSSLNVSKLCDIVSRTNSEPFRGCEPGTVIVSWRADRKFNGREYWKVKLQLTHRPTGFNPSYNGLTIPMYERTDFSKFTAEEFEAK